LWMGINIGGVGEKSYCMMPRAHDRNAYLLMMGEKIARVCEFDMSFKASCARLGYVMCILGLYDYLVDPIMVHSHILYLVVHP
jgi:hypothetical protein